MVKAIALWSRPDDPSAFEKEYFGSHMPFANAAGVPGMKRIVTSRALDDDAPFYRVAELIFDDTASLNNALQSAELAKVVSDGQRLEAEFGVKITLLTVEEDDS